MNARSFISYLGKYWRFSSNRIIQWSLLSTLIRSQTKSLRRTQAYWGEFWPSWPLLTSHLTLLLEPRKLTPYLTLIFYLFIWALPFGPWFDPIIWPRNNHLIKDGGGWVEFNRVNGALAMSRALGDFFFKQNLDAPLHKQIVTGKKLQKYWFFLL